MAGGDPPDPPPTEDLGSERPPLPKDLRLVVTAGPDRGRELALEAGTYYVGKSPSCELALSDPSISRKHVEVVVQPDHIQVRDLGSTNGSYFEGARFELIRVGRGAVIQLGHSQLRLVGPGDPTQPAAVERFGDLIGSSPAIRAVFAHLAAVAASDTPVLIQGETGTGKELAAEALHAASARRDRPMVVCDLSAAARGVIDSELFGHRRGAFTGADRDRAGAFAEADGGTIFLDEIGELEPELQPRLLRALERGQVKPVGAAQHEKVDVRVIAATNRDLRGEVHAGRFRRDLYHRVAVVHVTLPPLRARPDDVPLLVDHFLAIAADRAGRAPPRVPSSTMAALAAHDWPGNVRELKNVLDRALALCPDAERIDLALLGLDERSEPEVAAPRANLRVPFKEAKERLVEAWERDYLALLLRREEGNMAQAARRAGIDRPYLYRLLKKHGIG